MLKRFRHSSILITAQMKIISLQQRLTKDNACVNPLREFPWVFSVHSPIETESSQMPSQMRLANINQRILCFCWQGLQLQSKKANMARGRLQSLRSGQLRKPSRATARKWQLNNSLSFIIFNDYKVTIITQSHQGIVFDEKESRLIEGLFYLSKRVNNENHQPLSIQSSSMVLLKKLQNCSLSIDSCVCVILCLLLSIDIILFLSSQF